ncbi:unnamed protein product [Caenorhabditis brenneri]
MLFMKDNSSLTTDLVPFLKTMPQILGSDAKTQQPSLKRQTMENFGAAFPEPLMHQTTDFGASTTGTTLMDAARRR